MKSSKNANTKLSNEALKRAIAQSVGNRQSGGVGSFFGVGGGAAAKPQSNTKKVRNHLRKV